MILKPTTGSGRKLSSPATLNEVTFVVAQHSRPMKTFMSILSVSLASLARLKLGWIRNVWMYVLNNIV